PVSQTGFQQGPIRPQPHPVPLHFACPPPPRCPALPRRSLGGGGSQKCRYCDKSQGFLERIEKERDREVSHPSGENGHRASTVTVRLLRRRYRDGAFVVGSAMNRGTLLSIYSCKEAGRTQTWLGSKGWPESSTP